MNALVAEFVNFLVNNKVDFVLMTISSFLGFLSAMTVETLTRRQNEKKDNIILLNQLNDDLIAIQQTLVEIKPSEICIFPYHTAAWNVAVQTGKVANLTKYRCYKTIVETFNLAAEANRLEYMMYEYQLNNRDKSGNNNSMKDGMTQLKITRENLKTSVIECLERIEKEKTLKHHIKAKDRIEKCHDFIKYRFKRKSIDSDK